MDSVIARPSFAMRSANHFGTCPLCRGRSAEPDLFIANKFSLNLFLIVPDLAIFTKECSPVGLAHVFFNERDLASWAGLFGMGEPVLLQHELFLPFIKIETVGAGFFNELI